jgi:hypothetical protein
MSSLRMCHRVVLVGSDFLDERIASIFRVKTINELNTLAIASESSTLRSLSSFTSVIADMTGHCFAMDVIERYLYGIIPR